MGKIILITGGARSGKSTFAEVQVKTHKLQTAYVATAVAFDDSMKNRIKKHIDQRPEFWTTFEQPTQVHEIIETINQKHKVMLLDCITVLLTNTLFQNDVDWDTITEEKIDIIEEKIQSDLNKLVKKMQESDLTSYLVTNEIGSGIVPENKLARIFRDIAGRGNQYLASVSDEVYYVVSGIPMKIKG